jgi:hypothetical protein
MLVGEDDFLLLNIKPSLRHESSCKMWIRFEMLMTAFEFGYIPILLEQSETTRG